MIQKEEKLRKGDILRNDWCDDSNPTHYGMYIGRGKIAGMHDCIMTIDYAGRKHGYAIDGNRLVVVGHIDAYDELVAALKKLDKSKEWNEKNREEGPPGILQGDQVSPEDV